MCRKPVSDCSCVCAARSRGRDLERVLKECRLKKSVVGMLFSEGALSVSFLSYPCFLVVPKYTQGGGLAVRSILGAERSRRPHLLQRRAGIKESPPPPANAGERCVGRLRCCRRWRHACYCRRGRGPGAGREGRRRRRRRGASVGGPQPYQGVVQDANEGAPVGDGAGGDRRVCRGSWKAHGRSEARERRHGAVSEGERTESGSSSQFR